jgi:secreted trypsin-like serine protease
MKSIVYIFIVTILLTQEALSEPKIQSFINHQRSLRIIGGKATSAGIYSWMVSIKYKDSPSICGGSLIHPYWVLTAAHCMDGYKNGSPPLNGDDVFVIVGLHQQSDLDTGERIEVAQVIQHQLWNVNDPNSPFDIALLQLKQPSTQSPVNLFNSDDGQIAPGTLATVLGWGFISDDKDSAGPDELQEVDLAVVTNRTCQVAYQREHYILNSMLCAGYAEGKKDACPGDSGGPLVTLIDDKWTQIGIVSSGGKKDGPMCGGPDSYGIYTRVSSYLDFILKYVPLPTTAGIYDGAWVSPLLPNMFIMLRNTAESIVVVFLNKNGQSWQALFGPLTYPTITVTNFIASANMIFELKPTITALPPIKELNLTAMMCRPISKNDECLLIEGNTIKLKKIF